MARGENNVRYAQPPTKAASAVYVTLVAQVLSLGALVIFEQTRGRRLAAQLAAFGGRPRGADAEAVVGAVTVFAVLMMLVAGTAVAAAAAYVTWLVRARQANDRTAPTGPVAAAWLIPGVNLLAPMVLVDDVWRGARPPLDRRTRWLALLGAWWLSWLGALALITIRVPMDSSAGDLTGVGGWELGATALAALLCAATVRQITRIQRSQADPVPAPESAQAAASARTVVPTVVPTVAPTIAQPITPPSPDSAPIGHTG
ncbi:DUF4328 domain-containing protein [Nonomuraea sp. NPDC000554]|uniref:DUF4328 domain-containing protein n=1 Tax=Nonomuraea sp. NPDC000554 TaxID=3154259 RepID=UPI00332E2E3B